MKAINNNIVIKPLPVDEEKSTGGFLYTSNDIADARYHKATIVECQEGLAVKSGDTILYDRVAGFPFRHQDQSFRIIQYRDIVLIL